jgi:hypothetical protein
MYEDWVVLELCAGSCCSIDMLAAEIAGPLCLHVVHPMQSIQYAGNVVVLVRFYILVYMLKSSTSDLASDDTQWRYFRSGEIPNNIEIVSKWVKLRVRVWRR